MSSSFLRSLQETLPGRMCLPQSAQCGKNREMAKVIESSGKTPVSELNEYAAKQHWKLPDYTLVKSITGTHQNSYTYSVSCNSIKVCGTSSSKKDAKQLAAKNMIEKLQEIGHMTHLSKQELDNRMTNKSPIREQAESNNLSNSSNVASEESFVNYIGKLGEYCINENCKNPMYRDMGVSGPSHLPTFTIQCAIGDYMVNASANTKKKAKQDAAQKMLNNLVRNLNKTHSLEIDKDSSDNKKEAVDFMMKKLTILDLTKLEQRIPTEKSIDKAVKLLPTLERYSGKYKSVKNVGLNDLHNCFKNSYDQFVCETVQSMINSTLPREELLNDIANLLGLKIEYNRVGRQNRPFMVVGTLNSTPKVVDIGVGMTYAEAKDGAMEQLLNSIETLFN